MNNKIIFAWSSGKDSAMALHELKRRGTTDIAALLTTVTEGYDRVSMHGVRRRLLLEQADALGFPLEIVIIPPNCPNEIYEQRMQMALEKYVQKGVSAAAFGDLFLEGIRAYREERMQRIGMSSIFPLWGMDTKELARQFNELGFRAVITCVDTQQLEPSFAGREYNKKFVEDLPGGVDPCGENGEFHSFAYDGPIFSRPIMVERGEMVLRDNRFYYCDLL
jgi:uncharacterized protein (TIGR00290 family)